MKYVKPNPNIKKVIHRRCEYCSMRTDTTLPYKIMDKWACLSCGNKEICKWSAMVADANADAAQCPPLDSAPRTV